MASLLKLVSLPRLHLPPVLMLVFLLAGLFPEKILADAEAPASPLDGSGGSGSAPADASASGGSPNGTAAKGRGEEIAIKCYIQPKKECRAGERECLKPDFDKMKSERCEGGDCMSDTIEYEDGSTEATRGCPPHREWIYCITELNNCLVIDSNSTAEENKKKLKEFEKCVNPTGRQSGDEKKVKKRAICSCSTRNCNTRTSSGPTGAKHFGYKVALVVIFPLLRIRTLSLVG